MREHILSAKAHGALAGCALPDDEGRRIDVSWSCKQTGASHIEHRIHIRRSHAKDMDITFDVESPLPIDPPALADVGLLTAIFPAMEQGGHLHMAGEVSGLLVRNLLDIQGIWIRMRPDRFRPFSFSADGIREDYVNPNARRAVVPFSRGLDSMYTLYRHTDPARPLGPATADLEAAVYISGVDAIDTKPERSQDKIPLARECAQRRGLPLIVLHTNWDDHVDGFYSHGAMLAASLTALSGRFGLGLVGAGTPHAMHEYPVWGSASCVDVFYGSASMEIRSDGSDVQRDEKCAAISAYPEALEHIHVCIPPGSARENCCRCEKCTRTMLNFIAVGEEIPPAFAQGLDLAQVPRNLETYVRLRFVYYTLVYAREMGTHTHPAMRSLRRAYRLRDRVHRLREHVTRLVPFLDLMKKDVDYPRWLVRRRARRALDREHRSRAKQAAAGSR